MNILLTCLRPVYESSKRRHAKVALEFSKSNFRDEGTVRQLMQLPEMLTMKSLSTACALQLRGLSIVWRTGEGVGLVSRVLSMQAQRLEYGIPELMYEVVRKGETGIH